MIKILISTVLLLSSLANAADFTLEIKPRANSVGDLEVTSLSSSKIFNLDSILSSKLDSSQINLNCQAYETVKLNVSLNKYECQNISLSSSNVSGLGSLASKSLISDLDVLSISSEKISGLGTLSTKSSLLESDIPSLSISKINNLQLSLDSKANSSSLGSLATKSIVTNTEILDNSISSSKILNFATDVLSSLSATLNNYLSKTNSTAYTPTDVYHPATKKYVDDNSSTLTSSINTKVSDSSIPTCSGSQVLTKTGVSTYSCVTPSGSTASVTTKTSDYTITTSDSIILADLSSGNITLTLPTAVGNSGKSFTIKVSGNVIESSSVQLNLLTIATTSSQLIDSDASLKMATINDFAILVSNGSKWLIQSQMINSGITYFRANSSTILNINTNNNFTETTNIPTSRVTDPLRLYNTSNGRFTAISSGNYSFSCSSNYGPSLGNTSTATGVAATYTNIGIKVFNAAGTQLHFFYEAKPILNVGNAWTHISTANVPMQAGDYATCHVGGAVVGGSTSSIVFTGGHFTVNRNR